MKKNYRLAIIVVLSYFSFVSVCGAEEMPIFDFFPNKDKTFSDQTKNRNYTKQKIKKVKPEINFQTAENIGKQENPDWTMFYLKDNIQLVKRKWGDKIKAIADDFSQKYPHIDYEKKLFTIIAVESGGDEYLISEQYKNGKKKILGIGLGQISPETAKFHNINPYKPLDNIRGVAKHLTYLDELFDGRWQLIYAAYVNGHNNIKIIGGVPTDEKYKATRRFVQKMKYAEKIFN